MYSWQGLLDFENESCGVPLSHLGRAQVLLLLTWKYLSLGTHCCRSAWGAAVSCLPFTVRGDWCGRMGAREPSDDCIPGRGPRPGLGPTPCPGNPDRLDNPRVKLFILGLGSSSPVPTWGIKVSCPTLCASDPPSSCSSEDRPPGPFPVL